MSQPVGYRRRSTYDAGSGALLLETAGGTAPRAPARHPRFFDGFVTHPGVVAEGILQLAAVAAAEYVERGRPGRTFYDPVVTSDGRRLRLESFSVCGGVLARLDLLPDGLEGAPLDVGTTNIDVNEPLRRTLAGVGPTDFLHLMIGPAELVATTPAAAAVEARTPLPPRWVRGFAESQRISATFEPRLELPAPEALRFLTSVGPRATGWVVPAGRGWRLSARPVSGSIHLSRLDRLATLLPLLRHASTVRVHGPAVTGASRDAASAWELVLPDGRFVLTVSADAWRGFSGEGALLEDLATRSAAEDAESLLPLLSYDLIEPADLADRAGLSIDRVRAGLACLAALGRVGYDVAEAAYFHRDLPYDAEVISVLNPRLRGAEVLLAAGAVTRVEADLAEVRGEHGIRHVRRRADGTYACTCEWWVSHRGERGPCKHVLAVRRFDATVAE